MRKDYFLKKKRNGGYTIIETMISVAIFVIVISAGMNALLSVSVVHQKSQDIRSIMDSLSFVLEDMSRNMRTGSNYYCILPGDVTLPTTTRSCATGVGLAFEASGGIPNNNVDQWLYYVTAGKLYKSTNGGTTLVQLTPDEVVLDAVSGVSVLGAEPAPTNRQEPFTTIRLSGKITFGTVVTPFLLQTSISQRLVDI